MSPSKRLSPAMRAMAISLALAAGIAVTGARADDALDAAKKDMAATLGPDAVELTILPKAYFVSTWAQAKAGSATVIPQKYHALIGLAVSSQIPCQYCIYADTSDARLYGATDEEIREAVMFAAMTREWSTILNGNMADLVAFKKEIDTGAAAAREAMKKDSAAK